MLPLEATGRQPLLHDASVALRAPAQVWSRPGGEMREPIDGVYVSDVRVASAFAVRVGGETPDPIATLEDGADRIRFVSLPRGLDDPGADPDMRLVVERRVRGDGVDHVLRVESRLRRALRLDLEVELVAELTPVDVVKTGRAPVVAEPRPEGDAVGWGDGTVSARLGAPGARLALDGSRIRARWEVE
ncbi:MAG: glycogen debranching N-terminal domain-containing protein, partial [Protaetiibacter sp.]